MPKIWGDLSRDFFQIVDLVSRLWSCLKISISNIKHFDSSRLKLLIKGLESSKINHFLRLVKKFWPEYDQDFASSFIKRHTITCRLHLDDEPQITDLSSVRSCTCYNNESCDDGAWIGWIPAILGFFFPIHRPFIINTE